MNRYEQVDGFLYSGYDEFAEHPTSINLSRQSKFLGPSNPKISWEYILGGGETRSNPIIGRNGIVYIGHCDGKLHAIKSTGESLWAVQLGRELLSPVLGQGELIYVGTSGDWKSKGHRLFAINTMGEVAWDYLTDAMSYFSPVLTSNGMILSTIRGGKLIALDIKGRLLWEICKNADYWSSPAISLDELIYITNADGYLYCVDYSGDEKWKYFIGKSGEQHLSIDINGTIYAKAYYNESLIITSIDRNGQKVNDFSWSNRDVFTPPVIGKNNFVYVCMSRFKILAINKMGEIIWESDIGGFVTSTPLIDTRNNIYLTTTNSTDNRTISKIVALNNNGEKMWEIPFSGNLSWPVISSNNSIYAAYYDPEKNTSKLYAIT